MESRGFSIGVILRRAWELYKLRWTFLSAVFLLSVILPLIPQILQFALSENAEVSRFLVGLIHLFLMVIATMGFLAVTIKVAKEEDCSWGDFFNVVHLFFSFLWAEILFYLAVIGGLLLLIVPGIIFGIKFSLWPYFVLDRRFKGVEALKASNSAVYGFKWDICLLWIATFLLNILGALFFGIGLFVTVPVTMLAWALVYLRLSNQLEG